MYGLSPKCKSDLKFKNISVPGNFMCLLGHSCVCVCVFFFWLLATNAFISDAALCNKLKSFIESL